MIRARFQRLLAVLETVNPKTFNMNTWMCGTQGCMIGHYIASGAAKTLRFVGKSYDGHVHNIEGPYGTDGFDAVAIEFGIDTAEAHSLFGSRSIFKSTGSWQKGPAGLRLAKKRVKDFMRSPA